MNCFVAKVLLSRDSELVVYGIDLLPGVAFYFTLVSFSTPTSWDRIRTRRVQFNDPQIGPPSGQQFKRSGRIWRTFVEI